MRTKPPIWLALLLVLVMVVAGCTSSGAGDTTTTADTTTSSNALPETTATTQEPTTTAPGGGTATPTGPLVRADADLVIWADDATAPAITVFADRFAEENGVTVAVQELGFDDIRDRMVTAAPAGEGPDIVIGTHEWVGQFVTAGVIAPLDITAVEADFSPASVAAFNYEGTIYGLPYGVENIALVRNTELVPDSPATFEDLVATALELQQDGAVTLPLALQENGNGDPFHNYPIVTAFGGYVFGTNADGSYNPQDIGIDSPGGLAAAQYFGELSGEGVISIDTRYEDMIESFATGASPFAITGPWALNAFDQQGATYVVEPIPPLDGGDARPFISVRGFMVSSFAENPLVASSFLLDYMATEEAQEALFEAGDRPPAHIAVFDAVSADNPHVQGFGLAGANGYPTPSIPEMGLVWQPWIDAYASIFTGTNPEDAFTAAADRIRTLIADG